MSLVFSQVPAPPSPALLKPTAASEGKLSPSISWKCDGWQVEGEGTGLLRSCQLRSLYPLVFHLAQHWASHPDHTHTLECSGQWWIPNLPAAGLVAEILLQERQRPPWFTSLSLYPLRRTTLLRVSLLAVIWGPDATAGAVRSRNIRQLRCTPVGPVVKKEKFNRSEAKEQYRVSDIERLRVSSSTGCFFHFLFFLPLLLWCRWPCQRALAALGADPSTYLPEL